MNPVTRSRLTTNIFVINKTARPATAPFDTVSHYDGTPFLLQCFTQFKYRFSERFGVIGGLHGMHLDVNNSAAVEPRLSFTWLVAPAQSLSLSYGLHSQLQPLPVYFQTFDESDHIHDSSNRNLGFTRAQHLIAGYEWRFLPDWRIKAEAYYQYLFDVPVEQYPSGFSMLNAGADFGFPIYRRPCHLPPMPSSHAIRLDSGLSYEHRRQTHQDRTAVCGWITHPCGGPPPKEHGGRPLDNGIGRTYTDGDVSDTGGRLTADEHGGTPGPGNQSADMRYRRNTRRHHRADMHVHQSCCGLSHERCFLLSKGIPFLFNSRLMPLCTSSR